MNMKQWVAHATNQTNKTPFPILSYPAAAHLQIEAASLTQAARVQAEVMVYLVKELNLPAAMTSMDLSVEAACFGAQVDRTGVPAVKGPVLQSLEQAESLTAGPLKSPYPEAVHLAKQMLGEAPGVYAEKPVMAGISGPFSLAGQLRGMTDLMMDCYDDPKLLQVLLEKLTEFLMMYAQELKSAGADGLMIAEPLAGVISLAMAAEFSHPYVKRLIDSVQDETFAVVYHNCGGGAVRMLPDLVALGAMGYHFGNAVNMTDILPQMPRSVLVMGNIDPAGVLAHGTPESVREAAAALQRSCAGYDNFWLSTGCDVPPDAPWENILAFMHEA